MAKPSRSVKPAEADVIDPKLVREAVDWIRDRFVQTLHKGMSEVGEYILDRFFKGDGDLVRSKSPNKNASFRSLVGHCGTPDLPVGRSALHASVRVALMVRSLPKPEEFMQLPPSHQATLVPLYEDAGKVERLAHRALTRQLSVRELKEAVLEEVAKTPIGGKKRGPRPKALILKTLDQSLKLFTLDGGKRAFNKSDVEKLTEADVKRALKAAEALHASLGKLIEKLRN